MSSPRLLVLLLAGLLFAPMVSATEGRAAPQCAKLDLSDVVSSSSGVAVEPGACVIIDIGVRSYTTTLAIDIEVLDDAMDVLMFDQNSIQVYENGQNYRSYFNKEASFEAMLGPKWLDWAPPGPSSDKSWHIVFDNSQHDGDEGMGDQGGVTSRFKLQLAPAAVEDYPLVHNTYTLQPGERINLANFNVDGGTGLSYWAHPLSGDGDLFIQSDNQLSGDLIISGTAMENFGGQDTTQIDWSVPVFLNLQNLNLMAEAGSTGLHFSVKAWFNPILNPVIVDYSNSETTLGENIALDAGNTPNGLGQISSYSWDFDSDNIPDATGKLVDASWDKPGIKTVNLTVVSQAGDVAFASTQIEVTDIVNPTAVILGTVIGGGGGLDIDGNYRLDRTANLSLVATNSFDDDAIASASWSIDGESPTSVTPFTFSRSEIGTYVVTLTVTDPSGNIGTEDKIIRVYDSTKPILVTSELSEVTELEQGEEVQLRAGAADAWDSEENLRFNWDFDLERDSDGDGDSTNDPDKTGTTVSISFDELGETKFAVTVYDASNNSDSKIFTIDVVEGPSQANLFAIIAVVFLVIIVVAGVALFGYKGIQRKHALELLIEKGLSKDEATVRIQDIARSNKLPAFAKAAQMAGITGDGEVKSAQQMQSEAKAQEFAAIYGNDPQADPNAGFRPMAAQRQVDPALAEAALAAFADEPQQTAVVSPAPVTGKVKSGGVALPRAANSHNLKTDCTACGKTFSVDIPPSIRSAVVSCPACGSDQLFER